jgi:cyclase
MSSTMREHGVAGGNAGPVRTGNGMRRVRVMPTLLIDGRGRLVKTVRFGKRTYIGDPINAVKIFNTKEVDELVLFDIDATREGRAPNYELIADIVGEAFMPVGYGGGIRAMGEIERLYKCGIEKVVLSSAIADGTGLIEAAAARYGVQAVAVCLQVKRSLLGGYGVRAASGTRALSLTPEAAAQMVVAAGAGELIVYAIDRDGSFGGYDLGLLGRVAQAVDVPVVACGGARSVEDFRAAVVEGGCSAVAAGSLFVYQSGNRGVLISYPSQDELKGKLFSRLA